MNEGLVYVGKVIDIKPIDAADFIVSATVDCLQGGKWNGVVTKDLYRVGDKCVVYMPDAIVPQTKDLEFMKSSNWRVRMQRFRGAPSEVVIMPALYQFANMEVGADVTQECGVTKYHKPVRANIAGKIIGSFPSFIPRTDEPNFQSEKGQKCIEKLLGKPYYITEKLDGTSCTIYKHNGHFGVCSRNWEIKRDDENVYWKMAVKYYVENRLPEGCALQGEICGPGIQGNPLNLPELKFFLFSEYLISERKYAGCEKIQTTCYFYWMEMPKILEEGMFFEPGDLQKRAEGFYESGNPREGIVIRSKENLFNHKPASFKVINLDYLD